MILIFSVLVIAYYYFAKDSLKDYQKLTPFDSKKKKNLTTASLIASIFILVSGLILLGIAITDLYSDPYINKINIPWNLPEARVIVRRDFRNNPNNIQNGICISYEAITGEKNAEHFIRTGQITLEQNDIIAIYSDSFVNFLKDTTFINEILHFNKEKLEDYVNKKSLEDYNLYGKEKTLVLIKHI